VVLLRENHRVLSLWTRLSSEVEPAPVMSWRTGSGSSISGMNGKERLAEGNSSTRPTVTTSTGTAVTTTTCLPTYCCFDPRAIVSDNHPASRSQHIAVIACEFCSLFGTGRVGGGEEME